MLNNVHCTMYVRMHIKEQVSVYPKEYSNIYFTEQV